jgi:hypothetical protein
VFSTEISVARQFAVVLQPGDDVLGCIAAVCAEQAIEQGYFPVFLGAFSRVSLIGTCGPVEDPDAPLREAVHLGNVEGTGSGTIAWGPSGDRLRRAPAPGDGAVRHRDCDRRGRLSSLRTDS